MKINGFDIVEGKKKIGSKTTTWDVKQEQPDGRGFWLRHQVDYYANNAKAKEDAMQAAIDYANKATPYD